MPRVQGYRPYKNVEMVYEVKEVSDFHQKLGLINLHKRFHRLILVSITTLVFSIVFPIIILFFMLMLSGWLWSTHAVDNVHMTVWGWLTDLQEQTRTVGKGKNATQVHYIAKKPNLVPVSYELVVWTVYFMYLLGEGISWVVGLYAHLSRRNQFSERDAS